MQGNILVANGTEFEPAKKAVVLETKAVEYLVQMEDEIQYKIEFLPTVLKLSQKTKFVIEFLLMA